MLTRIAVVMAFAVLGAGCLSIPSAQLEGPPGVGSASSGSTLVIKSNGGGGKRIEIPLSGQGMEVPPCQFVVAPSAVNCANPVPVGSTSNVLSFEIQNVGVDICLVQLPALTDGFSYVSTSIPPDPVTGRITIPPPAPGVPSSLTVDVDLTCTTAGPVSASVSFEISDPSDPNQVVPLACICG